MKNLKCHLISLFILTFLSFLISCTSSKKQVFRLNTIQLSSDTSFGTTQIFLDISAGMKGYVMPDSVRSYSIQKIVPNFIREISVNVNDCKFFTFSDVKYPIAKTNVTPVSKDNFLQELGNRKIFNGESSKLNLFLSGLLDSMNDRSLSIIITDAIIDVGDTGKNSTEYVLQNISGEIYERLQKRNLSVAVVKYWSDFNGSYYYNYKNQGGKDPSSRPFFGRNMKRRPFYFIAIGENNRIIDLFSKNIFKNYVDVEFFNIKYQNVYCQLVENLKNFQIIIDKNDKSFRIIKVDKEQPTTLMIGLNLSLLPEQFKTQSFLDSNLHFEPSFIKFPLNVYDRKSLDSYLKSTGENKFQPEKLDKEIAENGFTHFVKVTFDVMPDTSIRMFSLVLNKPRAKWVDQTHIENDCLPYWKLNELEDRTYSLKYLLEAFYDRYKTQDERLFKIDIYADTQ